MKRCTSCKDACADRRCETCHRCGAVAETIELNLRSGLIGRVCPSCHTCRRGRPYAGRWSTTSTTNATMPSASAKGRDHDKHT